jgi:ABC-type amino acid transport substrate-binding protein
MLLALRPRRGFGHGIERVSGRRFRWSGRPALPVAAVLVALTVAGCSNRNSSPAAGTFTPRVPGVLTVATALIPTTGFWDGTSEHVTGGFEYELARDFARRFGLHSVHVEIEPFQRIVSGHLDGADLALALISPTAERKQHLDFSDAYLDAAPTVVARTGTEIPDLAAAQQMRWGALRGSTFDGIISHLIAPDDPIRLFSHDAQIEAALEDGAIDAAVFDMPYAVAIARGSGGRLRATAQLPVDESIAAALPRGSSNVQAVNSAIHAFTADGTIDALTRRWVGTSAADAENSIPLLRTEL